MTEPTRELTQADADKLAETILQLPREQFFRKEIRAIIWQAAREVAPPVTGEGWISVKTKLPEMGKLNPYNTFPRHYFLRDENGRLSWDVVFKNRDYSAEGITHWLDWQPPALPDPPKEGKP